MSQFPQPVAITGIALRSCLGSGARDHFSRTPGRARRLRPLPQQPTLPAGWLEDRACLKKRRYGAAGDLAVTLAQEAFKEAGWKSSRCRHRLDHGRV